MLTKDYTAKLLNLEDVIITNVENIVSTPTIDIEPKNVNRKVNSCL